MGKKKVRRNYCPALTQYILIFRPKTNISNKAVIINQTCDVLVNEVYGNKIKWILQEIFYSLSLITCFNYT
jgi:hypothetical protein